MNVREQGHKDWAKAELQDRGLTFSAKFSVAFKVEPDQGDNDLPFTPDYIRSTPSEPMTYRQMLKAARETAREMKQETGETIYLRECAWSWETGYIESPDEDCIA